MLLLKIDSRIESNLKYPEMIMKVLWNGRKNFCFISFNKCQFNWIEFNIAVNFFFFHFFNRTVLDSIKICWNDKLEAEGRMLFIAMRIEKESCFFYFNSINFYETADCSLVMIEWFVSLEGNKGSLIYFWNSWIFFRYFGCIIHE